MATMSSRQQIDSVIDDDEELCPLCIEEFDLSDKNFRPCPCGYQICQFCYNNIKTHSEEGRCPNCRRLYDESTIQYKVPDADEFKADLALKHRKAAAAKKKETEKREIEASSRKNLAGVRVVQKNLVYVIGLNPTIRDETQLLQTLRGPEYFGQYGEIDKIVVSKAKPGGNPNQGIGVYVTYATRADAATCIAAVDGSPNGDRVLRAQFGTTKYCSSFLRNEQCHNRNCTFLHETGEDSDSYSRQDLSSMNTLSSQRHSHANPAHPRPSTQVSQPMRRQPSKDDAGLRQQPSDGPALPSSASWANKDAVLNRTRRTSITGSQASQSPRPANSTAFAAADETNRSEKQPQAPYHTSSANAQPSTPQPASRGAPSAVLENLVKAVNSPEFKFVFSTAGLSAEEVALIDKRPSFIDPHGGVKRRAMREKSEQERAKREQELLHTAAAEEDNREGGSLQLGGEPDDPHPARGSVNRDSHGAIQPPSQQGTTDNSTVGSPVSAASQQFQGLNLGGRSLTPLQQQQLMLLKSANNQQSGLADPLQGGLNSAYDQASQAQNRQSSRFSFANDANAKNLPSTRIQNEQASLVQSGTPNPLAAPTPQQAHGNSIYTSGAQGPPPGLKTAGTPPISGGGMFAQGHGFTSNLGLGANLGKQENNPELMRELLRGRSGAGASGLQGQEAAKREYMFPFLQQHSTPPPLTPANGLLSSFYGSQAGSYPEHGPQKQKKKGKKQRHANTSSGGGGVVDLADPSILQARMHQAGANAAAGQALYGSQGQVDEEFPPLSALPKDRRPVDSFGYLRSHLPSESQGSGRSGTPTLPPGLPLPHAHPAPALLQSPLNSSSPSASPAPGLNDAFRRLGTPSRTFQAGGSRHPSPELKGDEDNAPTSARVKNVSEISLGSPVSKVANNRDHLRDELTATVDAEDKPGETGECKAPPAPAKSRPIKPDLPLDTSQPLEASPLEADPAASSSAGQAPAPASATGSRPNTPLTGVSRTSESSAARQPRVLRVVDSSKHETPAPTSASQSTPPILQSTTAVPRKPSLSSLSRPETPGDLGSEGDLYTSTSASRTNSPPASSRIGSAPVRSMTKSQAKKERKQKAKVAEAKTQEVVAQVEEPVQAPIVGRKRKTKKTPASAVEPSGSPPTLSGETAQEPKEDETSENPEQKVEKTKQKEKPKSDRKLTTGEEKAPADGKSSEEPWRLKNTLEQMLKDSESSGVPIKELFLERTSPLQTLLAQLHKSGDLDLNNHPLFNPSNLNQRFDMKCVSEDFEALKHPIELTEEHRKALLRGEPVRISGDSGHLKDRCLISPRGCVLHHLSREEEDRYLAIEKSVAWIADAFQEYPGVPVSEPDTTNRGGGLDALFATPENFNICWVDEESAGLGSGSAAGPLSAPESPVSSLASAPLNVLSTMEADSTRSHNWAIANSAELVNATAASVRSFAAATAKHMLGAAGVVMNNIPDLDDVVGMTDEELRSFALKSQKELEGSRKELDSIDKKLAGLLKRNRKLTQLALATDIET